MIVEVAQLIKRKRNSNSAAVCSVTDSPKPARQQRSARRASIANEEAQRAMERFHCETSLELHAVLYSVTALESLLDKCRLFNRQLAEENRVLRERVAASNERADRFRDAIVVAVDTLVARCPNVFPAAAVALLHALPAHRDFHAEHADNIAPSARSVPVEKQSAAEAGNA